MIIAGDISSPLSSTTETLISFLEDQESVFGNKCFISNLEGLISDRDPSADNQPLLSNHSSLPNSLKNKVEPVFCLANNHVLDLPNSYDFTVKILQQEHIPFGGVGRSAEEALKPIIFEEYGQEIVLFNVCWNFLLYNHKNPGSGVYVAELDEGRMIKEVSRYKESNPESSIVVYLHWNLDLEQLPFPIHRQFSRALVDAGARVVAGTHAHCVQGGETYKDGYIVYGLGNFFMPHHLFVSGRLAYPAMANMQLALEWNPVSGDAVCHWIEYRYTNGKHTLYNLGAEPFEESEKLKDYSPFLGMTDKDYISYYKRNRRKRILIPVYTDYKRRSRNRIYTWLLIRRATIARILAKMKLISWQN